MSGPVQEYRGEKIVVRFDGGKCIHSRCVRTRQAGGIPGQRAGCMDQTRWRIRRRSRDDGIGLSLGRHYLRTHGWRCAGVTTSGKCGPGARDGPLAIQADLRIGDANAHLRATLCRCGASKNKPYCDGSHTAAGFRATGEPPAQPSEPLEARNGTLALELIKNGPLHLSGNLELVSGTGRTVNRMQEAWLCRCGESKNKPYCDGTHKRIGFKSD